MIIEKIDPSTFTYFKNEENTMGVLGITHNKIVDIPNFISSEASPKMIAYFESMAERWGDIAFYGSSGMGLMSNDSQLSNYGLPISFFDDLRDKFKEAVELVFERPVKANTSHAQKWDVGGFANPHSDNSDFEGNPNAFEINKYVAILYLNDDYEGGTLYFPDHGIEFKPNAYSLVVFPGGVENVHGVNEITSGTRYTMVSFWDFAEAEYSEERKIEWEEEIKGIREFQAKQKEEWAKGNKLA